MPHEPLPPDRAPTLHRSTQEPGADTATLRRSDAAGDDTSLADIAAIPRTELIAERRAQYLTEDRPVRFAPGAVVKQRFVLKEKIGEGGMGIVFSALDRRKTEARDPHPLIAIKVMNAEVARHPSAFMALQREARRAQALAHPNIATVFDFDREGDTAFMCMELLSGRSLDHLLHEFAGRSLPRDRALRIVRDVAEGLSNAHRNGIVHSDLKPGNIFLAGQGDAKILDFGIARAVPRADIPPEARDPYDSRTLYAYTAAYATAEMVQGSDPHPADDVYALSIIVYQLFAGAHPFQRYSAPQAKERSLRAAEPRGLKRHEWRTVQRGLSFDRAVRPQSAAEFLAAFFPVYRQPKALVTAVAAMAAVAAYVGYQNYQVSGPAVAFASLPAATQQEYTAAMNDGDRLWRFYLSDSNFLALQEAAEAYASAYRLHPGNRRAANALDQVADAALQATQGSRAQQRGIARALAQRSEYLAKYPPIIAASE